MAEPIVIAKNAQHELALLPGWATATAITGATGTGRP